MSRHRSVRQGKDGGEEQAWLKAYRQNHYIFIFQHSFGRLAFGGESYCSYAFIMSSAIWSRNEAFKRSGGVAHADRTRRRWRSREIQPTLFTSFEGLFLQKLFDHIPKNCFANKVVDRISKLKLQRAGLRCKSRTDDRWGTPTWVEFENRSGTSVCT